MVDILVFSLLGIFLLVLFTYSKEYRGYNFINIFFNFYNNIIINVL